MYSLSGHEEGVPMGSTSPQRQVRWWLLSALLAAGGCGSYETVAPPPWKSGDPVTLSVGAWFPPGTVVRDAYGGGSATVDATGSVTVTPGRDGVALLEKAGAAPSAFDWKNATVYFVMTDRFANGDPSNDHAYGRQGDGAAEIGTWHGGDLAGLTAKLDYIAGLGVTALWISPVVEQVHGWVGGGNGDFKYYGYHGYWALDFTQVDANLGTAADLQALVDAAHARGIRVLLDVVLNHPGYATGADLVRYLPEVFRDGTGAAFQAWSPGPGENWQGWNQFVDYGSTGWRNWWANAGFTDALGRFTWIRAGQNATEFPGFAKPGSDDLTRSLSFLPDFITEGTVPAGVPTLFARKAAAGDPTGVAEIPGGTVRDYLVKWQSDWVGRLGVDGFRCDTAKNVELASWKALKDASVAALAGWKAANPAKKLDDAPFWMTGEVFGHGVAKDGYFTDGGFDSVLNFSFQPALASLLSSRGSLAAGAADLEGIYAAYATALSADPSFDVLSYLSSHDTQLFSYAVGYDEKKEEQAATALMLAPGGVQIFYGDESGRAFGPTGTDPLQGTRSDMNWAATDTALLRHWQLLGAFRKRHAAVGAGTHTRLGSPAGTYAFARSLGSGPSADAVVAVITPAY